MLMDNIAKASREQAAAIDEVSVAVRTMDEMTQHNAALVEQTNAAIEQTEAQASELDRVIDIFKLEDERARLRRRGPRPVAKGPRAVIDNVRSAAKRLSQRRQCRHLQGLERVLASARFDRFKGAFGRPFSFRSDAQGRLMLYRDLTSGLVFNRQLRNADRPAARQALHL